MLLCSKSPSSPLQTSAIQALQVVCLTQQKMLNPRPPGTSLQLCPTGQRCRISRPACCSQQSSPLFSFPACALELQFPGTPVAPASPDGRGAACGARPRALSAPPPLVSRRPASDDVSSVELEPSLLPPLSSIPPEFCSLTDRGHPQGDASKMTSG